jgi:hypothetical protein
MCAAAQVVGLNTPLNQQAGYYCNVCDCVLRDSQTYLSHINGKYHNRALGMSMKVERSTVEQVRQPARTRSTPAYACSLHFSHSLHVCLVLHALMRHALMRHEAHILADPCASVRLKSD